MWSIAIKTLVSDRGKLLTALVGVLFSVVLVNIQGGLFLGLIQKAALLVDQSGADIWVGHRNIHAVDFPRDIPSGWVHRIRSIPGVRQAEPYMIGFSVMTLPSGGFENVVIVGVDQASGLGNAKNIVQGSADAIRQVDGIIVDESDDAKLEYPRVGELREIGNRRARIVAKSYGIAGFLVTPYVFTTYDRAATYSDKDANSASYFLVQLDPGVEADETCRLIRSRLPDVDAFPTNEFRRISINYWMTRTGLGISFGAATVMGLLIGLVMVAQTLYALVLDRVPDFATLKAIGATERQVYSILLMQAVMMAVLGSLLGLTIVAAIQTYFSTPKSPIMVPLWLSLSSFGLVLIICLVSSLLPYLRIRRVDPMMVLQS
jgi:putative ABC transport system permease protein